MAKKSLPRRTPKKKTPAAPTLADVLVTWKDDRGVPVRLPGVAVARLATYLLHRHGSACYLGLDLFGDLRALPMARGLSGILFPDAGSPTPERHADERFFVSEALGDLAASIDAEQRFSREDAHKMTLEIAPGIGMRTLKTS